ncbi:hypothetical protein [Sphingomonas sp.]|uniref:hypothetical protein n=1 Tax=Sphingomonas sp. TaxID=28214 RepID=UPI002CB0DED6|nr:hypothetical protein [Sphingomonas sp.]HWK35040.1 hypothetical protein [Sphingomonas sp.]
MIARLRSYLPALALALVLTLAWTGRDWPALAALSLPDTDDVMRLQQVRDWIAGQPFGDLHQYRLSDGLLMHWSRIGDLVPAAIIVALRPLIGVHAAEVTAVIAWPALQFALHLMLVAGIARRLVPSAAGPAVVLAALAYPVTTLFMPGRIDHHGLQIILCLVQVRALIGPADARSGAIAALAATISAAIGLETAPFAVVAGVVIVLAWWRGAAGADRRQIGFGAALLVAIPLLLPIAGSGGACDTMRPLALPAAIAAATLVITAALGRPRWWLLVIGAGLGLCALFATGRACLAGPYGAVDPLMARLWLAHVEEAQPLFAAPWPNAVGYAGLLIVGIVAGGWLAWRRRGGWIVVLAFQLASLALTCAQLRGAYVGAALAVVPIAALIVRARAAGRIAGVLALWLAGAGLLYPAIAGALSPRAPAATAACPTAPLLATLRALPPGRVMAPIDMGAFIVAGTRHTAIAAPYHRNNAGNAAMYRFFLGAPDAAEAIARRRRIDHVVLCPDAFAETGPVRADSLAGGARPAWLVPDGGSAIFAVRQRLSDRPGSR